MLVSCLSIWYHSTKGCSDKSEDEEERPPAAKSASPEVLEVGVVRRDVDVLVVDRLMGMDCMV